MIALSHGPKRLFISSNDNVKLTLSQSPADIPVLSHILDVARRLLAGSNSSDLEGGQRSLDFRIGFVGSMISESLLSLLWHRVPAVAPSRAHWIKELICPFRGSNVTV